MGSENHNTYSSGPCPNCDKDGGAIKGTSTWGHSFLCCSDECGLEIKEKLEKNESSKEYKKLQRKLWKLKDKLCNCRYKDINGSEPFFEF